MNNRVQMNNWNCVGTQELLDNIRSDLPSCQWITAINLVNYIAVMNVSTKKTITRIPRSRLRSLFGRTYSDVLGQLERFGYIAIDHSYRHHEDKTLSFNKGYSTTPKAIGTGKRVYAKQYLFNKPFERTVKLGSGRLTKQGAELILETSDKPTNAGSNYQNKVTNSHDISLELPTEEELQDLTDGEVAYLNHVLSGKLCKEAYASPHGRIYHFEVLVPSTLRKYFRFTDKKTGQVHTLETIVDIKCCHPHLMVHLLKQFVVNEDISIPGFEKEVRSYLRMLDRGDLWVHLLKQTGYSDKDTLKIDFCKLYNWEAPTDTAFENATGLSKWFTRKYPMISQVLYLMLKQTGSLAGRLQKLESDIMFSASVILYLDGQGIKLYYEHDGMSFFSGTTIDQTLEVLRQVGKAAYERTGLLLSFKIKTKGGEAIVKYMPSGELKPVDLKITGNLDFFKDGSLVVKSPSGEVLTGLYHYLLDRWKKHKQTIRANMINKRIHPETTKAIVFETPAYNKSKPKGPTDLELFRFRAMEEHMYYGTRPVTYDRMLKFEKERVEKYVKENRDFTVLRYIEAKKYSEQLAEERQLAYA